MELWEYPNNGADSTNNPPEVLIEKFRDNYDGTPITIQQTISYLSHPHWFDIYDAPTLRTVFDYINQHSYKKDKGPVIFMTYEEVLERW